MVVTTLTQARDLSLPSYLVDALDVFHRADLSALTSGIHEIDKRRVYLNVVRADGRGKEGAALEAHRKYVDLHLSLAGQEWIGWRQRSECGEASLAYNPTNDVELFSDRPARWIHTPPGTIAIFFPDDAHAPLGGEGLVHKVVMKVRIEGEPNERQHDEHAPVAV